MGGHGTGGHDGRYGYDVELAWNDGSGAARFEADAAAVREALGPLAREIEPIGSLLVPDMVAKQVMDLMVAVLPEELALAEERLGRRGLRRIEVAERGRTMFRRCRPGTADPDLHVHLVTPEAWHASHERAFYRLMLSDRAVVEAYSAVKRLALELSGGDPRRYGRLKGQFIDWVLEAVGDGSGRRGT